MATPSQPHAPAPSRNGVASAADRAGAASADRDVAALLFVAEMYGVQLDQLATVLGVTGRRASEIAARWVAQRRAQTDRLGPGARWVWLTKAGLVACGLPYAPNPPALSRLAHIRAVTAARLALESVPAYAAAGAHWRSERRLRARLGGRLGTRDHLPDAEVHWPDGQPTGLGEPTSPGQPASPGQPQPAGPREPTSPADLRDLPALPWAGECWAIEAELTPKTVTRTVAIMRELLTRTGDYGCPAADVRAPGRPPRHARVIYLCSPAAAGTVGRARAALGDDGARIEIRELPADAYLPAPAGRQARL